MNLAARFGRDHVWDRYRTSGQRAVRARQRCPAPPFGSGQHLRLPHYGHLGTGGGSIADFPAHLVEDFSWARFLSIQIWLMVLFLVYVTIHELNVLFGDGELYRLFFLWRSSEAKLTRRQRIRLLTRLNRLTESESNRGLQRTGIATAH